MSILEQTLGSSGYIQLIYDQTILGMDYLDLSNQVFLIVDFTRKVHNGHIVNLHRSSIRFSIVYVKVVDG